MWPLRLTASFQPDGHKVLFEETLGSIPEGQQISDASSTSPSDSAVTAGSTPQTEVSGIDSLETHQVSKWPGYAAAVVAKEMSPLAVDAPSPACAVTDHIEDTYVLEDAGPLLTFLRFIEPGFTYQPTSTILNLWPQIDDNPTGVTWSMLSEVRNVADYLCAARSHADAFDLYYVIFCHLHKTMETYDRRHLITAVLNCARSSSTDQQSECAIAVLRLTLRDQGRGTGDHISAGVLHLYLGELYKKQKNEKSEASTATAIQHLAIPRENDTTKSVQGLMGRPPNAELYLPLPLYTSLIIQSKRSNPAYARHFSSSSASQRLAEKIRYNTIPKYLLNWCTDAIGIKAAELDPLAGILKGDTPIMKEAMARLLFCCFSELWLKDTRKVPDVGRYFAEADSALTYWEIPWPESLAAMSFVIADEAFRESDPLAATKKRFWTRTLATNLVRTTKVMLGRINDIEQSFTDKLLAFLVVSEDDSKPSQQVDQLSRKVLEIFAGNIVSSGILREEQGSPLKDIALRELGNISFLPVAAELREYVICQRSPSRTLYTPRSSFSSGARSLRALHSELGLASMLFLSTSKSKGSLPGSQSRHSSWSFEMVTGLGYEAALRTREGGPDAGPRNLLANPEDTIMIDV